MATPAWLAATAGQQANAGALTQFTGAHTSLWAYSGGGVLQAQGSTGAGVYQSLASGYMSQAFTAGAGQTAIGRVALQVSTVGGSPLTATISPLTLALYAASSQLPTGDALAVAAVPEPYVYGQPFWCSVPLLATGLSPSAQYCLVVTGAGSPDAYYVWQQAPGTGAATAPDGATWTAQPYSLMFEVYDTTASGVVTSLADDGGARIVDLAWSGTQLTGVAEYTQAQGGGTLVQSRTLAYSNGLLVGVT